MMDSKTQEPVEKSGKGVVKDFVLNLAYVIILALLIRQFVFTATVVKGQSMEPTFHDGDRVITLRFPMVYRTPHKGEVVILKDPTGSGKDFIKRVIATEGDHLVIQDGQVFINDERQEEAYIASDAQTEEGTFGDCTLSQGEFFVMGDNRYPGGSYDSRFFGPVTKKDVVGIATIRYWPLSSFGKP